MSDQPKYVVHHADHSAIGDHANANNYISAQAAEADPGAAELLRLFEEVNKRLEALEADEREMVKPAVQQTAKAAAQIQQGDDSPEKQAFLEKRLKNLRAMAPEIGQVIIATLANPAAGIALTIQKIAQKAQAEAQAASASH